MFTLAQTDAFILYIKTFVVRVSFQRGNFGVSNNREGTEARTRDVFEWCRVELPLNSAFDSSSCRHR